jgi:hypothetical protein
MGLSSNSLIHFTNTKENLRGILTENFKIKYCFEETIFDTSDSVKYAVPMVSFCDIPFSEVKKHLSNYGPYGIGFTKEWATKNKLNPVIYLERYSNLAKSYWTVYNEYILQSGKQTFQECTPTELCVFDLMRYMKNYQNDLIRAGKVTKDYRFSDEREWRYVPEFSEDFYPLLAKDLYDSEEKKIKENNKLSSLRLEFEPNDIKYIIIEQESDIPEFLDLLRTSKGKKYTYHDVERLMTRLMTTEQIVTDF